MTESGLVTVITPAFNAVDTLPWALASIMAQTYENWELIIVDDGSAVSIEPLVRSISDTRIRFFRLDNNKGRGYCRALALENARGDYLAMMDADDWAYPWKLDTQVRFLRENPNLVAVSCPMAIVDSRNSLTGIRCVHHSEPWILRGSGRLEPQLMSFPAAMFVMTLAKNVGFRPELRHAEDRDFMIRALESRSYAIWYETMYSYRQEMGVTRNTTWNEYREAVRGNRRTARSYVDRFPVAACKEILLSYASMPLAALKRWAINVFGTRAGGDRPPTESEELQFKIALADVQSQLNISFIAS